MTPVSRDWIDALPKAESHQHLECIGIEELERLAARAGVSLPRSPADLESYDDLDALLASLDFTCGLVRTHDDAARIAYRLAMRGAASGVRYLDAIVNPTHWTPWAGRLDELVEAFDEGFARAEAEGGPPAGLCVSLLRLQDEHSACALADEIVRLAHPRVVALSIDGNEKRAGLTGARFAPAFDRARAGGLRTTAHTGESGGPDHVRDTLTFLHPERIDHGVRAVEDDRLVEMLRRRSIPLNICVSANIHQLGWYRDLDEHPVDRLRRAGVRVSLHTDDPMLFSLAGEYTMCADAYGWSRREVRALARTSIEQSFAPAELRTALLAELDAVS